jgi:hypothetical protein
MSLENNPDEFFGKPLSVYPMTNPTPQTPEPPADGELQDEELLRMAADATGYGSIAPGEYEPGERPGDGTAVECYGSELIAYGRAAIAADRARHPQAELMAEALRRLRRWGGLMPHRPESCRYACDVVLDVCDWIDAGMTGPLPPLPKDIARQGEQSNG